MTQTFPTTRYLLKSFSSGILFGLLTVLITVVVTNLVYFLTIRDHTTQQPVSLTAPFEVAAGLNIVLLGLVPFIPNFKVMLANGISRRTFVLANLPAAGAAAAIYAIFNLLVEKLHGIFLPLSSISELIYPQITWAGFLFFQIGLYVLLIAYGSLTTLIYYRSSPPVKWVISLMPFVLFMIILLDNFHYQGVITRSIGDYLRSTMDTPLHASISMLAYSILFYTLIYLLIRRAPLKE